MPRFNGKGGVKMLNIPEVNLEIMREYLQRKGITKNSSEQDVAIVEIYRGVGSSALEKGEVTEFQLDVYVPLFKKDIDNALESFRAGLPVTVAELGHNYIQLAETHLDHLNILIEKSDKYLENDRPFPALGSLMEAKSVILAALLQHGSGSKALDASGGCDSE